MKFFCDTRSRHWFLLIFGLAIAGVGIYALQYGMRRWAGNRGEALRDGSIITGVGIAVLALRFHLVNRPRRHWLEVDTAARTIRLVLGGVEHSERSFEKCGPLRVAEVWCLVRGNKGGYSRSTRFDVWMKGFARPVFIDDSRGAADEFVAQLSGPCGFAVEPGPEPSRERAVDTREQIERVAALEKAGDEAGLLEYLDPRVELFDSGSQTAIEISRAALGALGRCGTVRSAVRLGGFLAVFGRHRDLGAAAAEAFTLINKGPAARA